MNQAEVGDARGVGCPNDLRVVECLFRFSLTEHPATGGPSAVSSAVSSVIDEFHGVPVERSRVADRLGHLAQFAQHVFVCGLRLG